MAILYFFVGACVCLLICVNPNDPGVLGSVRKIVFDKLPTAFSYADHYIEHLWGESLGKEYSMHWAESNIIWCKLTTLWSSGSIISSQLEGNYCSSCRFTGYTFLGIFKHMPNAVITDYHIIAAYVMAGICFYVYYKACSVSPGQI